MIPRILSKRTFCFIFSMDGQIPVNGSTLYKKYIAPHLEQLEITEEEWKGYRNGLPYKVSRAIIAVHQIEEEEIEEALGMVREERNREFQKANDFDDGVVVKEACWYENRQPARMERV